MYDIDFISWKEEQILRELQADGVPVYHVYRFLDRLGVSHWVPPVCYSPLIHLILLLMFIWVIRSWMFVTLSFARLAVYVARFLAIRFGPVTVKQRVLIVANCPIDLALILPFVLNAMDPTL